MKTNLIGERITAPTNIPSGDRRPTLVSLPERRPTTVPAVLRRAARILAVNGHHQGDYLPDPFNRRLATPLATRPLSIVAALRCAVSGDPRRLSGLSESAIAVLAGRLEVDGEPARSAAPMRLEDHVERWGDVPGRTAESAVAVLEAAADAVAVSL